MPKGQYDRTKTKAQRDAEKKASAAPAEKTGKRTYTKRADKVASVEAAPALTGAGVKNDRGDLFVDTQLFNTFSSALPGLKGTALHDTVLTKLTAVIERLEPTPAPKQVKAEKVEKVETVAAPVPFVPAPNAVPAPIPYTPVPFNGTTPQ